MDLLSSPPMYPLDVRDLVRITAIADHGGFTRAARALGMTQPALTRSISAAERAVGGQLFVRRRPRAEPTALCRMILAEAPGIVARMQDLHRRLDHVRGGSGEELAVASGPFPLESLVLPAVAALRRAHPRVRVRLETLPWPEAVAQLPRPPQMKRPPSGKGSLLVSGFFADDRGSAAVSAAQRMILTAIAV